MHCNPIITIKAPDKTIAQPVNISDPYVLNLFPSITVYGPLGLVTREDEILHPMIAILGASSEGKLLNGPPSHGKGLGEFEVY